MYLNLNRMSKSPLPLDLTKIIDRNRTNYGLPMCAKDHIFQLNPNKITTQFNKDNTPNKFIILQGVVVFIKNDDQMLFIPVIFK